MEETILQSIERKEVYYKTMITTHEVTIGQQSIRIQKLEEQIGQQTIQLQRQEEKLAKAQEVVEDNVQTILRLQAEAYVPENVPLLDWPWGEPEPYPYTHPIRDIGTSGRIKEKK